MDPLIELLPTHVRKKPGWAQTNAAGAMQEVLAARGEAHLRFVWVAIVESETVVARDLNRHKEHVEAEYVSRDALTEVTSAINRLAIDWIICLST
jgi:hypothetical protein